MDIVAKWGENVGTEARKSFYDYLENGFFDRFISGSNILDVGYRGYSEEDVTPIVPWAIGIDLNYPDYDGRRLPFADGSQDCIFASHVLEHIEDYNNALVDWHRVLRVGGHIVIAVPHQFLYERRLKLPSRFNGDHKRLYTPRSLLAEIESALPMNSWRLRFLEDNDKGFDYATPPHVHASGRYEIVVVIEKIKQPDWVERACRFATLSVCPASY